jgi:hypothetical protein
MKIIWEQLILANKKYIIVSASHHVHVERSSQNFFGMRKQHGSRRLDAVSVDERVSALASIVTLSSGGAANGRITVRVTGVAGVLCRIVEVVRHARSVTESSAVSGTPASTVLTARSADAVEQPIAVLARTVAFASRRTAASAIDITAEAGS